MLTGRNQFGYMSDTPGLKNGDKIKADFVSASGYDLGEFSSICVPTEFIKTGKVKEPKDLDGKPIATAFGSISHRQILTFAHENQIKPQLLPQSIDQQMASLNSKSVYAAVLWEPYPSWLEKKGIAVRWKTGQNMPNTTKQYTPESEIATFRDVGTTLAIHDWMRERPDVMAAYLKAEEECRDMMTNAPDTAAYYIWTDISEIPPQVIRATIDMIVWDGRINDPMRTHLNACAKQWLAEKFLTMPRTQDPEKYISEWADDKLLHLAMQEMEALGQWTSNQQPGFPNPLRPEQMQRQSWEMQKDYRPEPRLWNPTKV